MPRYMLDTDTCSYVMKRSSDVLLKRLKKTPVSDVCISVITKSELLYGVEVSPRRQQDDKALTAFLRYVEVLDFRDEAAPHYARIRAQLRTSGTRSQRPFYSRHARSLGLTLVTNNTREFGRVQNLAIENWTVPGAERVVQGARLSIHP